MLGCMLLHWKVWDWTVVMVFTMHFDPEEAVLHAIWWRKHAALQSD